jgi:hypothetical protein
VARGQAWFYLAFEHCVKGGAGKLLAWLSRGGERRRDQSGEIHVIEAYNSDILVLVQILLHVCFCPGEKTLQILSGQDSGPNVRSAGCFSS